ncbi:MAG: hypothetical protein HN919_02460 [Verrucomicrobia bacterium]|nr:hypothetical protein [Verrucomicrobiota bacterium]
MKRVLLGVICFCLLVSVAAVFTSGCDEATGLILLGVEPAYVDLTPGSNIVEFVISTNSRGSELGLPLEWIVTDPSLGRIVGSGGYSAIYIRFAPNGDNTIIARDQYDNEGFAVVRQMVEQYGLTLTANPDAIQPGQDVSTITITRDGGDDDGTAPFTWTTLYPGEGVIIAGQGSDTVIYRSNRAGMNVVQCTDAFGVIGSVIVLQR